jgi:hypothetical protein
MFYYMPYVSHAKVVAHLHFATKLCMYLDLLVVRINDEGGADQIVKSIRITNKI